MAKTSELKFDATAQYGDWKGTAAADYGTGGGINALLRNRGLIDEDERVCGISLFQTTSTDVSVLVYRPPFNENAPLRHIQINLTLDEFLQLFTRLEISLEINTIGMETIKLHGRTLEVIDEEEGA